MRAWKYPVTDRFLVGGLFAHAPFPREPLSRASISFMSRDAGKLLEEALHLPPEGRAALATRLIESLDGEVDEDAEAAWSLEISRRLGELDSGSVKAIGWAAARRLILGSKDAIPGR